MKTKLRSFGAPKAQYSLQKGGLLVNAAANMMKGGFGKKKLKAGSGKLSDYAAGSKPNTDKRASLARATSNRIKRARGIIK